jgi:hypothetical protein
LHRKLTHVSAHRKYFELAVMTEVMDELKSGDLFVEHSGDYDDYRNHLVDWDEYERDVGTYGELVGLPVEARAFVSQLREKLSSLACDVDKRFPENGHVDIDQSGIVIRRMERPKPPPELEAVEQMVTNEMDPVSILDVLTETEKWLDLQKLFGPLSGFEAKVDDPRKRFITTLFCYGCNLGVTQTARSVKGLSRKQVAWLILKHVTEQRLDKAIVKVINAYNRFALPRYWGSGKSASADGTNGTSTRRTCCPSTTSGMAGMAASATTTCPTSTLPCSAILFHAGCTRRSTSSTD